MNLPHWARETMKKHAKDKRDPLYSPKQMEAAGTYDDLWNATQKEMLLRGKIHGYYRMYWGKKILQWSKTYQDAVDFMVNIHGRYALDGRDPNTYTNILWCFGLHDPRGERPSLGKSVICPRRASSGRPIVRPTSTRSPKWNDPVKIRLRWFS